MTCSNIRRVTIKVSVKNISVELPREAYIEFDSEHMVVGRISLIPKDVVKEIDKVVASLRTAFYNSLIVDRLGNKPIYYMTDEMIIEFEKKFNELKVEFQRQANEINSNYGVFKDDLIEKMIPCFKEKSVQDEIIKRFRKVLVAPNEFYEKTFSFSFNVDKECNYNNNKFLFLLFREKILSEMEGVASKLIETANVDGKLNVRSLRRIEKLIKDSKNANADGDKTIISLIDTFESLQTLNIEQPKIAYEKVKEINKIISQEITKIRH
ncbi:hypothetical protein [Clostridium sp.]|uniref:hypothetical protein n=1 Tax=Clostridium sp. TaxID=1506 RepID=UPI003D6C9E49